MKTTVIYHSADFDGLFCHQIARKFLGDKDVEYIGWNFGDPAIPPITEGVVYVMDLPLDRPFGCEFRNGDIFKDGSIDPKERLKDWSNCVWIDHHKSSIETHPKDIPGYRIDGVAACRLAWQWFHNLSLTHLEEMYGPLTVQMDGNQYCATGAGFNNLQEDPAGFGDTPEEAINALRLSIQSETETPAKLDFINRSVSEPLAVRLAGEYDIWDKRDPRAELFQLGLRSQDLTECWPLLLSRLTKDQDLVDGLLEKGKVLQFARANEYRDVITSQGFDVKWEGLVFLACNSHEADIRSHLFEAGVKPHHEALLGFTYNGQNKKWQVSMYHVPHRTDLDLSAIAARYGGGGHRGACGFTCTQLPWALPI